MGRQYLVFVRGDYFIIVEYYSYRVVFGYVQYGQYGVQDGRQEGYYVEYCKKGICYRGFIVSFYFFCIFCVLGRGRGYFGYIVRVFFVQVGSGGEELRQQWVFKGFYDLFKNTGRRRLRISCRLLLEIERLASVCIIKQWGRILGWNLFSIFFIIRLMNFFFIVIRTLLVVCCQL